MNLIFNSSVSASFELKNDLIYYNDKEYQVSVNGVTLDNTFNTNVFSLFDLKPGTKYIVKTSFGAKAKFETDSESCAVSIAAFGATGDGKTLCTRAIQSAIDTCKKNGRVIVPEGTYLTGPIMLKSNITLELKKGARLLASTDTADYPILPGEVQSVDGAADDVLQVASWEGNPYRCYQSFVSAHHAENIKIVGEGTIDGNGPNGIWWINHKQQVIGRPRLFFVNGCDNVSLHGVTVCDSASWTLHPYFSKNINVIDVRANADKNSPNTDGCDPESCDNVNIIGTVFSVGDDCIAIKSGKIYLGKRYKTPCSNLTIRNCLMQYGHGAVVLGSEIGAGVKGLNVCRCLFNKTDRGLRIKTNRGRGEDCYIDNVTFENIRMDNVLAPLTMNMFYDRNNDPGSDLNHLHSKEKMPIDERTPTLGRFKFQNIECTDVEQAAGFFYGLPENPIKEVVIENVTFAAKPDAKPGTPVMMQDAKVCCKEGLYFNNVSSVKIKNVTFSGTDGEEVQLFSVMDYKRE